MSGSFLFQVDKFIPGDINFGTIVDLLVQTIPGTRPALSSVIAHLCIRTGTLVVLRSGLLLLELHHDVRVRGLLPVPAAARGGGGLVGEEEVVREDRARAPRPQQGAALALHATVLAVHFDSSHQHNVFCDAALRAD